MSNTKLKAQLENIEKRLRSIESLSSKQKHALARQLIQIIKKNETAILHPILDIQSDGKVLMVVLEALNYHDAEFTGKLLNLLKEMVKDSNVSAQLRIFFATVLRDQDTLFAFARNSPDKSHRSAAIQGLGKLGEKRLLLQLKEENNLDVAMMFKTVLELAKLGDLQFHNIENIIEKIDFFSASSISLADFLELARLMEGQYPNLAARMLYKVSKYFLGRPNEIISALKRLKASSYLIAIVKSEKTTFDPIKSNDGIIETFRGLEETMAELKGMDQALNALFEIKDKQALSEIMNDSSVFLHLRKKAQQYLKELETG